MLTLLSELKTDKLSKLLNVNSFIFSIPSTSNTILDKVNCKLVLDIFGSLVAGVALTLRSSAVEPPALDSIKELNNSPPTVD